MKIKRYNIEQLKKYSVVLSPAEQLMLLGGNRYEEGKYGVIVFDDDNNLIKIISYNDLFINGLSNYSELAGYSPSNVTQCTLSSGVTCFILQNSDFFAEYNNFTEGFTQEMIMGLEQYKVDLYYFNEDNPVYYKGKKQLGSHYNKNTNLIAMRTYKDDPTNSISLEHRVHEVIHSFQKNALNQTMDDKDTLNLEYQAYVVSVLFAKGKGGYNDMIDNWKWMDQYIHKDGTNDFYVDKAIINELGNQAVEWYLSNGADIYRDKMEAKGIEPILNEGFNYKWDALFQSLGIKVR
jgi:hypothetical protein